MSLVESKYKNPDKYIERLKQEVERSWEYQESTWGNYKREKGAFWFTYEDDVVKKVLLDVDDANQSRIGQAVKLEGTIIGYERNGERYSVTMELKDVRLIND